MLLVLRSWMFSVACAHWLRKPRDLEVGQLRAFSAAPTTGIYDGTYYNTYQKECLLWDSSCSGNRSEALGLFFNTSEPKAGSMKNLVYHACEYFPDKRNHPDCIRDRGRPQMMSEMVSWMRKPDCRSSFLDWHTQDPDSPDWTYKDWGFNTEILRTMDWSSMAKKTSPFGCCDTCELIGGNVDVYYWPVPGANHECTEVIGTSTTKSIDQNLAEQGLVSTDDRQNVWWASPPSSISSPPIQARGHTILDLASNSSVSASIAVIEGFTFTFPSIYVAFSNLGVVDRCGAIGTLITKTILAFAPGELSTVQQPVWDRQTTRQGATKSFNFADLPCPPASVMVDDQYTPLPGQPYRPVLAPPAKLLSLQPGWSNCIVRAFEGIDPPKVLEPATALVSGITSGHIHGSSYTSSVPAMESTKSPVPEPASKVQAPGPSATPHFPSTSSTQDDPRESSTYPNTSTKTDPQPQPAELSSLSEGATERQYLSEQSINPNLQVSSNIRAVATGISNGVIPNPIPSQVANTATQPIPGGFSEAPQPMILKLSSLGLPFDHSSSRIANLPDQKLVQPYGEADTTLSGTATETPDVKTPDHETSGGILAVNVHLSDHEPSSFTGSGLQGDQPPKTDFANDRPIGPLMNGDSTSNTSEGAIVMVATVSHSTQQILPTNRALRPAVSSTSKILNSLYPILSETAPYSYPSSTALLPTDSPHAHSSDTAGLSTNHTPSPKSITPSKPVKTEPLITATSNTADYVTANEGHWKPEIQTTSNIDVPGRIVTSSTAGVEDYSYPKISTPDQPLLSSSSVISAPPFSTSLSDGPSDGITKDTESNATQHSVASATTATNPLGGASSNATDGSGDAILATKKASQAGKAVPDVTSILHLAMFISLLLI